jgi:hypothetical protein
MWIAIMIAAFTAMGLLLALLHGIEAAIWVAAFLWLRALGSPTAAILYSVDSMAAWGASGGTALADAGRWKRRRNAPVRYQHGVYFHSDAVLLPTPVLFERPRDSATAR